MSLQDEIDKARGEIRSDGYAMSIGEWISLYERNELDIHPEFQRFFRWTNAQKSRLIESILLGIPVPPIFVSQRPDGVWDVVDGLQRLSTIFQLVGVLRDEDGSLLPPLELEETIYLPSLKGRTWENAADSDRCLSPSQQLLIKRSRIDVSIILRESDPRMKYELFQRLNTGGSTLSAQEVRNSIIVMINRELYVWLRRLADTECFRECIELTDRAFDEKYDMDLALRFVILRTMPPDRIATIGDIGDFLTERIREAAEANRINLAEEERAFRVTFEILSKQLGGDSFKKYDASRDRFSGGFLISAFEVIALGIGYNYEHVQKQPERVPGMVKQLWQAEEFKRYSGGGIRASARLPKIIELGRRTFAG